MKGPIVYGLLFGIGCSALSGPLSPTWGPAVFWSAVCIYQGIGTVVFWRRTGLPFATGAMAIGSAVAALLAALAPLGYRFSNLPLVGWAIFTFLMIVAYALMFAESRVHRAEWSEWRARVRGSSVRDFLLYRAFPRLRGGSKAGPA